jgi:hypothetical protein
MTQTLTTERLKDLALHHSKLIFPASHEEAAAMARELLANREAQPDDKPFGYYSKETAAILERRGFAPISANPLVDHSIPLYTAPPAPAVPPEIPLTSPIAAEYVAGWNACRAAMLAQPQNEPQNIPKNIPGDLPAAVNRLLDSDGSRGCFSAIRCSDAREEVERLLAQPVSSGYKLPPHAYRELVNSLCDTAVKYSGTDQLRERLNTALSQFIEPDHPHTRTTAPEGGNG